MEYTDLLKSALGAIVGFALAQVINLASLIREWFIRSRLVIEPVHKDSGYRILSHSTQIGSGDLAREVYYGFVVRNKGRRISTGVRFQILKLEYRERDWPEFAVSSDTTVDLVTYTGTNRDRGSREVTLVPDASTLVSLAWWREDYGVVVPSSHDIPDYYEEMCADAQDYRFTVVAFDDAGDFVTAKLAVQRGP